MASATANPPRHQPRPLQLCGKSSRQVMLGFWLLVFGIMEIVLGFRLRLAGQAAARIAPAT